MSKKMMVSLRVDRELWNLYGAKVGNRSKDINKHILSVCRLVDDEEKLRKRKEELDKEGMLIDNKLSKIREDKENYDKIHGQEDQRLIKAIEICQKHNNANGAIGQNIIKEKAEFFKVDPDELTRRLELKEGIFIVNFQELEKDLGLGG